MIRECGNRFAYIDVAKALAIFTVILGHAVTRDSAVFTFLFAFHMPAFFFFSGYCMKAHFTEEISFGDYAKKKMRALLVPYAVFVVYGLILAVLFSADWWNEKGLSYNLQRYLYYAQPTSVGASWFLICMLIASFLTYGAVWLADVRAEGKGEDFEDETILLEILLLACLGTVLIPRLDVPYHHRLPWKIDSAVTAASFQLLGYLTRKRKILEKTPKALRLAGLIILPLVVWYLAVQKNGYVNVCDICYGGNSLYFYAAALAGTLWLLDLGWLLQKLQGLVWLGKNSLVIFGIHTFPLWICTEIYSKVTGVHSYHVADLFWAVVISLITYAVCALFAFGWNRTLLHRKIRTLMRYQAPDGIVMRSEKMPEVKEKRRKPQNGDINVLKLLFTVGIVLIHIGTIHGYPQWMGAWIGVEWFFVFAGYTMTHQIYSVEPVGSLGIETACFVIRRVGTFFPYLAATAVIALLLKISAGQIQISSFRDLPLYLPDPLMLQVLGFQGIYYIGITWYLSALWVGLTILYPLLRRFRGTFDRIWAVLIPLFIYGYFDKVHGYLWGPGLWIGNFNKGLGRGIAGLCIGAVSYNIGLYLKRKFPEFTGKKAELASFLVYACVFVVMYKWDDSKIYYLIPFLFAVLIAVNMNTTAPVFPDNPWTRRIGTFSMLLFLVHHSWISVQRTWFPNTDRGSTILVAFAGSFVLAGLAGLIGNQLKPVWNRLFRQPERKQK